jgi:hypothetical protein
VREGGSCAAHDVGEGLPCTLGTHSRAQTASGTEQRAMYGVQRTAYGEAAPHATQTTHLKRRVGQDRRHARASAWPALAALAAAHVHAAQPVRKPVRGRRVRRQRLHRRLQQQQHARQHRARALARGHRRDGWPRGARVRRAFVLCRARPAGLRGAGRGRGALPALLHVHGVCGGAAAVGVRRGGGLRGGWRGWFGGRQRLTGLRGRGGPARCLGGGGGRGGLVGAPPRQLLQQLLRGLRRAGGCGGREILGGRGHAAVRVERVL